MGYASAIKRMYKKHEIMMVVAVAKLIVKGYSHDEAVKYLKS